MSGDIRTRLRRRANADRVPNLQRFFKTGPGDYAEGDVFIAIERFPEAERRRYLAGKI